MLETDGPKGDRPRMPRARAIAITPCAAKIVALVALVSAVAILPSVALAHGGGLNAEGCHNDRRSGGYHCHRAQRRILPDRVVRPSRLTSSVGAGFASCAAARAAGAALLRRGDPGYDARLDRDGDGLACEGVAGTLSAPAPSARSAFLPKSSDVAAPMPPSPSAALSGTIDGMAQVLDGDTVQIGVARIRLFGIDAFEGEQMCIGAGGTEYGCGGQATRALAGVIGDRPVACVRKGIDAYGRTLGICRVEATDLSSWMVREGHAVAYRRYALDYVVDEDFARDERRGAWSGSFRLPWDYRPTRRAGAAEAQRTAAPPSASCVVKGNVNRKGRRIYHVPGDPYYGRTKPENWFCSAAEAEAAGFRRAGRPFPD